MKKSITYSKDENGIMTGNCSLHGDFPVGDEVNCPECAEMTMRDYL